MENPYQSPQATDLGAVPAMDLPRQHGGIRRLYYFGIMCGLLIAQNVLTAGVIGVVPGGFVDLMLAWLFIAVFFSSTYYRLKNIGMNPWVCLGMLVPLVNLLVGIRCLAYQEGYADTKKLDSIGRLIVFGIVAMLIVSVVVVAETALRGPDSVFRLR